MKLHILGTAGYHGNGFRETTCLTIPELGIILDAGTGFFRLRKLLANFPENVPLRVFLSHPHLDHTIGLTQTLTTFHGAPRKLMVHGLRSHLDATASIFASPLFPLAPDRMGLEFVPLKTTDPLYITSYGEKFSARSCELPHPGQSIGYHFETSNFSFVYITDTDASQVRASFVRGAKTLIHECNFPDAYVELAKASGHSILSDVLKLTERSRVEKLVLMHFNNFPEMDADQRMENLIGELPRELPFEVVITHDNMVVEI